MRKPFFPLLALVLSMLLGFANSMQAAEAGGNSMIEGLRPKKFILSVGIGKFQSNLWRELRYSRKDADDVYNFFTASSQSFDGGRLLTDAEGPVSKEAIRTTFKQLELDNRNDDDTVIVYVSSHGTVGYKEDGKIGRYIIMSNTDPKDMKHTALDYDDLMDMFQKLKSRKKVLILAFCHSGVGKSVLTPEMKRALAQLKAPYFEEPIQERSEGTIVLTASGWREPALEDEKLQNDVYTHFLIEGFRKDRNGDGAVSITEAHAFAAQATYDFTQGRQRPSAIMELLGSDPVIVSGTVKKKEKGASLFSLMDRFSKLVISIDGKAYGSVEKGLSVPEGDVRLTIADPQTHKVLTDRVVNFQAGREYSIANYLLPRLPQSLSVGVRSLQFLDRETAKAYAPDASQGIALRYAYEEAFSLYDIVVDAAYYPNQDEEIEVTTSLAGAQKFAQKRSMVSLLLAASRRLPISALTRSDRTVRTDFRWLAGLNGLLIKRELEEAAFEQVSKTVTTGGFSAAAALESTWAYHLIKAGIEARFDTVRNFTEDSSKVLVVPSASVYMGTFW